MTAPIKPVYPIELLRALAVDGFVSLATADERQQWVRAHGFDRILSERLVAEVRKAHANRATNKRLGLPDPLR